MATSPQRAYRAACPSCGAPVEFASAASASAVCSFCRSTLVRDGEALRRIGVSAELFDDHSPLRLGATGRYQGTAFTLVGRLQYAYTGASTAAAAAAAATAGASAPAEGTWNEWHALFEVGDPGEPADAAGVDGSRALRTAWLSEDNGAYVLAFDAPRPADAPAPERLRAGERTLADGRAWDVASVVRARLIAAEGELPRPPRLSGDFLVADLRNSAGEVATLDGSDPAAPGWSVGRSVQLADLRLSGLAEQSEKTLGARRVECPSCGTSLEVKLATTRSISCHQCRAVVDLSAGVGGELAHYAQNNSGIGGLQPQIPLGRTGQLALGGPAAPWQVVGYLERCDIPAPGDDEETTFWREYLLYNRSLGFAFLVDAEDGWSWVRPVTGAPQRRGDEVTHEGVGYRAQASYHARVTWVQGEFYWRVRRDEVAMVTDYVGTGSASDRRLSREQTADEVVWSAGATLDFAAVAFAFDVKDAQRAAMRRDAAPVAGRGLGTGKVVLIIVAVLLLLFVLERCEDDGCDDYRRTFGADSREYRQCLASNRGVGGTRGGSFGGWSGGGGHK